MEHTTEQLLNVQAGGDVCVAWNPPTVLPALTLFCLPPCAGTLRLWLRAHMKKRPLRHAADAGPPSASWFQALSIAGERPSQQTS